MSENLTDFQLANRELVHGQTSAAIELYLLHAQKVPQDAPKCFVKIAEAYLRSNIVSKPLSVAPGVSLVAMGDESNAETYYRRALEVNSDYFPALVGLAQLLPDQLDERLELLERASAVRDDLMVLNDLATWYYEHRDFARAYEYYLKAQSHNPLDGTAYEGLQRACVAIGRPEEAREWSERWVEAYARKPRVDGKGRAV